MTKYCCVFNKRYSFLRTLGFFPNVFVMTLATDSSSSTVWHWQGRQKLLELSRLLFELRQAAVAAAAAAVAFLIHLDLASAMCASLSLCLPLSLPLSLSTSMAKKWENCINFLLICDTRFGANKNVKNYHL